MPRSPHRELEGVQSQSSFLYNTSRDLATEFDDRFYSYCFLASDHFSIVYLKSHSICWFPVAMVPIELQMRFIGLVIVI